MVTVPRKKSSGDTNEPSNVGGVVVDTAELDYVLAAASLREGGNLRPPV